MKGIHIYNGGVLTPIEESDMVICGFYAAAGFSDCNAGDLFAVEPTPRLIPCYDANGKRMNVGAELAGMSYSIVQNEWFNG